MLSNKTIEVIRICLQTMKAVGNDKSKKDIGEALSEFNEYVCDTEDMRDQLEDLER